MCHHICMHDCGQADTRGCALAANISEQLVLWVCGIRDVAERRDLKEVPAILEGWREGNRCVLVARGASPPPLDLPSHGHRGSACRLSPSVPRRAKKVLARLGRGSPGLRYRLAPYRSSDIWSGRLGVFSASYLASPCELEVSVAETLRRLGRAFSAGRLQSAEETSQARSA